MLRIDHVSKSFNGVAALRDVSLDLVQGEFVSFLGPSGCGKTTLLRIIAGLETPDGGEISLDGHVLAGPTAFVPPEQRHFGMVFQSYALWPHMTVDANLGFPLEIAGVAPAERAHRIAETLESLGLRDLGGRRPAQLSGGQQQRVALGRALVTRPRALLLDEPLSNVDAQVRRDMRFEIRRVQREVGVTAVYVTHDQEEALAMSDRIVVMDHGCIVQVGTPEEVYAQPRTEYVAAFVGSNVLEGVVTAQRAGKLLRVTVWDLGLELDVSAARVVGDKVKLAVHPTDVCVVPKDTPGAGTATVTGSSYLGDRIEVELAAGSMRLLGMLERNQPRPVPGTQVGVTLNDRAVCAIGGDHAVPPMLHRRASNGGGA
jgi:ABC-type Fe3+/spermidine/putrescine transport system ATPase subunit